MSDKNKKHKKKKRGAGCFVSCCMGWTVGVVIVVFIALLVLLAMFTVPFGSTSLCAGVAGRLKEEVPTPMPRDQVWMQCNQMANHRNVCIGQCDRPPGGGFPGGLFPDVSGPPPLPTLPTPLTDLRLNRTWAPRHYDISLQPWIYNESDARLNGSVQIYMMSSEATSVIVLHAENLTVDQGTMELREGNAVGSRIQIKDFVVDVPRNYIKIYTYDTLRPSTEYYLKMGFKGTLLYTDLTGFYRGTYVSQGNLRYVAVTQFEVAGARRAFPCFDEPSFKATFTITLVRRNGFTALSNTGLASTQARGDWRWDTFKKTPIMSTYIVAMFVGQYVSRERTTPRGTLVRVWAQPEFIDYVDVAVSVTGQMIEAFEDYTGIKYPLNKTDQIAVRDFAAGAMENWGLITYTEAQLLINPAVSTTADEREVIGTIAHEIAHQWFGNLVTMRWWDDTFLNEAFATYMGNHIGVPSVRPTWNQPLYFLKAIQGVMVKDTSSAANPVRLAGLSPNDDISKEAFTDFTYKKGAAIMRMFRYFLKEETFKKAIRAYLQEFSYGNAVKDDLINIFDTQARQDGQATWDRSRATLSEIATSWLDQTNYPLLEVTDLKAGRVRVKQSRFVDHPELAPPYIPPFSNYSWYVPLTYANSDLLNRQGYTLRWIYRDDVVNFGDVQVSGWKLANVFAQGFYRVKYDTDTWAALLKQLRTDHTLIPVESRSELIDDAFALATEGYTADVTALPVTSYLVNETEYIVFRPFIEGRLKEYNRLLRGTPAFTFLSSYVLELITSSYKRLGWTSSPQESVMDKYLRQLVLTEACSRNYQPCVLEAIKQFQQFKKMVEQGTGGQPTVNNPIDPDLRALVYCTAMRHGSLDIFTFLMNQFLSIRSSNDFNGNELTHIIMALTCAEEPSSLDRMLQWAMSVNMAALLQLIAAQPGIVGSLWDYTDRNWARIPPEVNKEGILWYLTDYFGTPADLQKLRHFLSDHPEIHPLYGEELTTKVKDNVNWVTINEPEIRNWLMFGRFGRQAPRKGASDRRARRSLVEVTSERGFRFRYPKMGTSLRSMKHRTGSDLEGGVNFVFRRGKLEIDVVSETSGHRAMY